MMEEREAPFSTAHKTRPISSEASFTSSSTSLVISSLGFLALSSDNLLKSFILVPILSIIKDVSVDEGGGLRFVVKKWVASCESKI